MITSKRIRPGMYRVTTAAGNEYNVTESQFSGQWLWAVTAHGALTSEPDLGLHTTKRGALAAITAAGL